MEGLSWLESLPHHSIFTDTSRSLARSSSINDSTFTLPSPDASTIHGGTSFATLPNGHGKATESGSNGEARRQPQLSVVARKSDLLYAVGSEVRIASLAGYKAKVESQSYGQAQGSSSGASASAGSYKTLNLPAVDFQIRSLVLSPGSKFCAVIGDSQLVVFELPRKGWETLLGNRVECSHDPIATFYHTRSSPALTCVRWHPFSPNDNILLALTSDGLLREYDILADTEEPTQIVDFVGQAAVLPSMSGRSSSNTSGRYGLSTPNSRSRKSAYRDSKALVKSGTPSKSSKARRSFRDVDDDATYATSFTLGDASSGDWGAFSLYCLMANGDIYSICPYLPKTSRVRRSDLETLSALISAKITYLSEPIESASSGAGALGEDEKYELEQRYALQAKWCRTLLAQDARAESSSADGEAEDEEEYMMVRFPASWRSVPLRQGPYLLQPSPRELDNSVESRATDLAYTYLSSVTPEETGHGSEDGRSGLGLGVLLIAYNDGKVDVCLDTERTEGAWGRIGENAPELPSLLVYESIDLFGSSSSPQADGSSLSFTPDPQYSDTIYIHHSLGAHSISLQPLLALLDGESALPSSAQSDVAWLLRQPTAQASEYGEEEEGSDSSVVALAVVNDVYLGYALILHTRDGQTVPIELSLRGVAEGNDQQLVLADKFSSPAKPSQSQLALAAAHSKSDQSAAPEKAYTAFGDAAPFALPSLFSQNKKTNAPSTRFTAPSSSSASKVTPDGSLELSIDSLRFAGQSIDTLSQSLRSLILAGNSVQDRLSLHRSELPRQVDKLRDVDGKLSTSEDAQKAVEERVAKVREEQKSIERKADRILQRLIDLNSPEMSSFEKRWAEELSRVEASLQGNRGADKRVKRLQEQLDVLRPQVESLREAKQQSNGQEGENGVAKDRMGDSQRKRVEMALAEEGRLLNEARLKVERLHKKLERLNGGKAPSWPGQTVSLAR